MTSNISLNNSNNLGNSNNSNNSNQFGTPREKNTAKNTWIHLKQYQWLALMSFVVTFFCTSLPVFMYLIEIMQEKRSDIRLEYIFIDNPILSAVSTCLAGITAIALFKYLNNKSEVDLFHSLPVSSQYIFISRYCFGLLTFILPYTLNFTLSYGLTLAMQYEHLPEISAIITVYSENLCRFSSVFSFACLGTIVTGNSFMAICTSLGFTQAPTVLSYLFLVLCDTFYLFFPSDYNLVEVTARYTNPIRTPFIVHSDEVSLFHLLCQTLVLFLLSYVCFEKRPSENASNPVALQPFKLIIKSLGVICGGGLGGSIFLLLLSTNLFNFLIGAFVIGLILHIAFEILFEMDIRAGLRNKKQFFFCYAVIAMTASGIYFTQEQYDNKISPLSSISSITWNNIELKDKENLELIHQMMSHAIVLDVQAKDKVSLNAIVTVHLNNGNSYTRNYRSFRFDTEEYLNIMSSQEYLIQSHQYNLTEETLEEMSNIYINYGNTESRYSTEEFKEIYSSITAQIEELTPAYLAEHTPVLNISSYNQETGYLQIPVYELHKEALNLINPHQPSFGNTDHFTLRVGSEETTFSNLEQDLQDSLLEEMTIIYDSFSAYINYNWSWNQKNIVKLLDGSSLVGYLSVERYEELLKS